MKQIKWLAALTLVVALLAGCGAQAAGSQAAASAAGGSATKITAEQAYERMNSGDPVTIVDVRRQDEYDEGHIPGAILVPNESITDTAPAELPDKNAEILLYCRSGNRSAQAAQKLADMGYKHIYDFGGIIDWPYEVTTEATTNSAAASGADSAVASAAPAADKNGAFGTFSALDLDGNTVTQDIFSDKKLTLVNVWGTYCGPCQREMPDLGALSREYADKGLGMVGIMVDVASPDDGTADTARALVAQAQADYTHVVLTQELYDNKVNEAYGVPYTVFVDANGNQVGEEYVGARDKASWAAIIDDLMKQVA